MRAATSLVSLFSLAIVGGLLTSSAAMAEDAWYPVAVDVWSPPFNAEHQHSVQQYVPPEPAIRPWRICASIPHLKDDYWLAVNFGLVAEAKRLGVTLSLYEAGDTRTSRHNKARSPNAWRKIGAQALIVAAISADGLNSVIADYSSKGIPVIDLINGITFGQDYGESRRRFLRYGNGGGKISYEASAGHGQGGQGCLVSRPRRRGLGRGR